MWQASEDLEVYKYRRRLPHWRMDGATYFVTWRLHGGQIDLAPQERSLVCTSLWHFEGKRYRLLGYVVMNDHVHAIVEPRYGYSLTAIVQTWKSFTAQTMQTKNGRRGEIWQDEYFDRIIRDDEELAAKLNYVATNPEKRWPGAEGYQWMWTCGGDV